MTPRALVLAGPTASGKSALAMALAQHIELEIISVDSAQVYRGMDVGTAKPSLAERAQVPHHLIDILDPDRALLGRALRQRRITPDREIHGAAVALLVGGTMLYLKALLQGLDTLPEADPRCVRPSMRAAAEGWPVLHAELARVDPDTATRVAPHDAQRIQRALEVWQVSGQTLSSLHGRRPPAALPLPLIALEPLERSWLHARIAERFEQMLQRGLLDEVRGLARTRRSACRTALDALRGLPSGLASAGQWLVARFARARHRRDAPAREAPVDLAAFDGAPQRGL